MPFSVPKFYFGDVFLLAGLTDGIGLLFKIKSDSSQARSDIHSLNTLIAEETAKAGSSGAKGISTLTDAFSTAEFQTSALAVAVGNLYSKLTQEVIQGLKEGAAAVLDYSSKLENAKVGFTTLTGSATTAQKHLEDLQKFAATTSFDFAGVAEASQKLQGAGLEVNKIIPLLTDFGNALAAAGKGQESMDRLVKAISDVQTKQHLATQEIRQFSEIGIPIYKILGEQLHKTTAEIDDLVTSGSISADVFNKAFSDFSKKNFGDAMAKQAKTFSGATENIKDSLLIVASSAFEPLFKQISQLSANFAADIQKQGNDFKAVGNTIAKYIGEGMGLAVDSIAETFGKYLGSRLTEIFSGKAFIDPIVSSFLSGFGEQIEKGYQEMGKYFRAKLGLSSYYNETPANPQSQNYQNPEDFETRLPGYNDNFRDTPLVLVPNDKKKKTAKAVGDSFDKQFREIAQEYGFEVSRTFGDAKNKGSLHPSGNAGDLRVGGKTNEQSFNVIAAFLEKGLRVIDERVVGAFKGIKSTGPNIHAEKGQGVKESLFLPASYYGGEKQLNYLKELDKKRRNKTSATDEADEFDKQQKDKAEKDRAGEIKGIQDANSKILDLDKAKNQTRLSLLDSLLKANLIKEKDYAEEVGQIELGEIEREKSQNDELLKNAKLSDDERAEILRQNAILDEQITQQKIKNADAVSDAVRKQTEAYKEQTEELNQQLKSVQENEREGVAREARRIFERDIRNAPIKAPVGKNGEDKGNSRLQILTDYQKFELANLESIHQTQIEYIDDEEKRLKEKAEKEIEDAGNIEFSQTFRRRRISATKSRNRRRIRCRHRKSRSRAKRRRVLFINRRRHRRISATNRFSRRSERANAVFV